MGEEEDYADDDLYPSRHRLIGKVVSVGVGLAFMAVLCGCPLLACLFPAR